MAGRKEPPTNVEADAIRKALNTEPSAVAPDAKVNFGDELIVEHMKARLTSKVTLASGATALGSVLSSYYRPRQIPTMRGFLIFCLLLMSISCDLRTNNSKPERPELVVAAAANLTEAFAEIGPRFTSKTGVRVVFSFGATADLAKQIENGAPFDVFASADTAHVDRLERKGLIAPGSRLLYARGRLVIWVPSSSNLKLSKITDITANNFERIAIAKPDVAPYGEAAVESLRALGIWSQVESRVIYAQNVSQAKQYVSTGNAEVAFIPLALIKPGEGTYIEVPEESHKPIDQALGIVNDSRKQAEAWKFLEFLIGKEGQELLSKYGYSKPRVE